MTKPLTVEQRRKVAEACGLVYGGGWSESNLFTLVRKVARMIEAGAKDRDMMASVSLDRRLTHCLATNNIPEIELLAWELISHE